MSAVSSYNLLFCRYESELAIRQSVEADIVGLRKLIDDTNLSRMNLESEIENLKEELIHLKKDHDNVSSIAFTNKKPTTFAALRG